MEKNELSSPISPTLSLRVFLSSPGDVGDERALARKILAYLPKERPFRGRVLIEESSWDDPGSPAPMAAHLSPQEAINLSRRKPSECDVVVVILWSRLGTPLPDDYRKSDGAPYRSGTEWEFLDAIQGAEKQAGRPMTLVYRRAEIPSLSLNDPQRDEKIRQYEAVQAFFEGFRHPDGSLRWAYQSYDSPSGFAERLERQLREVIATRLEQVCEPRPPNPPPVGTLWQGNPYRGLDAFREQDAPVFFGRGLETDALIQRMSSSQTRVLVVIGPSGCGKSSLVAAGLLPRLAGGAFPHSNEWISVRFTPAEAGDDPFRALAIRLFPLLRDDLGSPAELAEELRSQPALLGQIGDRILAGKTSAAQLLLFADQFEELFTPRIAEGHREPFVALVDHLARSTRARMVLTLRADYYEHCTRIGRFAELLQNATFPLGAPTARALTEMIERPALAAGLELEPGLVDAILQDTGTEPGSLALVEFTLERLYEARTDDRLTISAYRALEGVGGVIRIQGESAIREADGRIDAATLERVFGALADVNEAGRSVRKRARLDAFGPAERVLVERLIKARLLLTDHDDAGTAWVEVGHEAVLRHWPRLSAWLDTNRAFLLWKRRLRLWMDSGSQLLGTPLAEAKSWLEGRAAELDQDESLFIRESLDIQRRRTALRWAFAAAALIALVFFTLWQYGELESERERRRPIVRGEEWVEIPPGQFRMGSPPEDTESTPSEHPAHTVRVSHSIKMLRHEVTFAEYDRFAYASGRRPPSDAGFGAGMTNEDLQSSPVINVSFHDAEAYAAWLSNETGNRFRLPTETEWEYAARAGTLARRFWGDDPALACEYANVLDRGHWAQLREIYSAAISILNHDCDDHYSFLAPVGRFNPNPWGLRDMLGNVAEWVQDCWRKNYENVPADGSAVLNGDKGDDCPIRVVRGGSWHGDPTSVRSASRVEANADTRLDDVGFRLVQDIP